MWCMCGRRLIVEYINSSNYPVICFPGDVGDDDDIYEYIVGES